MSLNFDYLLTKLMHTILPNKFKANESLCFFSFFPHKLCICWYILYLCKVPFFFK